MSLINGLTPEDETAIDTLITATPIEHDSWHSCCEDTAECDNAEGTLEEAAKRVRCYIKERRAGRTIEEALALVKKC